MNAHQLLLHKQLQNEIKMRVLEERRRLERQARLNAMPVRPLPPLSWAPRAAARVTRGRKSHRGQYTLHTKNRVWGPLKSYAERTKTRRNRTMREKRGSSKATRRSTHPRHRREANRLLRNARNFLGEEVERPRLRPRRPTVTRKKPSMAHRRLHGTNMDNLANAFSRARIAKD